MEKLWFLIEIVDGAPVGGSVADLNRSCFSAGADYDDFNVNVDERIYYEKWKAEGLLQTSMSRCGTRLAVLDFEEFCALAMDLFH